MALSWKYHEVAFKASHNSYVRDEQPLTRQLRWHPDARAKDGCRGLELDLDHAPNLWMWSVQHGGGYGGAANAQLSAYLEWLRCWSQREGDHDVILVTLDLKGVPADLDAFPDAFDDYVERHLGRERIFAPAQLMDGRRTLVACAQQTGWPSLAELRGRFVLCLSGEERVKKPYAAGGAKRLCFADKRFRRGDRRPSTRSGHRVFFNFNLTEAWRWEPDLKWFARQPAFLTRGYILNDEMLWERARRAGVNVLATDKVRGHTWAKVGASPFRRLAD